jgi:hemolysin activation/secretion protein
MIRTSRKTFAPSFTVLALYAMSGSLLAQGVAPDSGQLLRDLQQTAPQALPRGPVLQRIEEAPDTSQAGGQKVQVKTIVITGNSEVPTAELMPLVAGLEGQEQTLGQLRAAARRITRYYRDKGFAVARAFLPAQDVTEGRVTITVVEGRISSHRVANTSLLSDDRVNAFLVGLNDGDVVRGAEIDRSLLLLQDTPGVGASRATLQPGASPGTSELLVDVEPSAPYTANLVLDNYGSRYTGEYRASGAFTLASPLKLGDQLGFSALTSGRGLSFGRLAYQLPVGSSGLRVGAAYFDVRYQLGKEFAPLQAHGTASSTTVYASYPIVRSQLRNLNATLSYEDKKTVDQVDSTATTTAKKLRITALGINGNLQDTLGGGGINSVDLSLTSGTLGIQSPAALAIDAASARSNGGYSKFNWSASRLQALGNDTLLWFTLAGQQARKNLDSSEKFSLGGPTSIRAYPTGEASGDEGWRGTLELRRTLLPQVQGVVFYDFGAIRINKTPFAATANDRHLAGAGFGVNTSWDKVQVKASLAWRTHGGVPVSIPASAQRSPVLSIQATIAF